MSATVGRMSVLIGAVLLACWQSRSPAEPGNSYLDSLARALTLHVSFDEKLDADYCKADGVCYQRQAAQLVPAKTSDELKLAPMAGRFGGALHYPKKGNSRPTYRDNGTLGYNPLNWNCTVSIWLRLDPDRDLEPGYCDPVQIIGNDSKKGYIFLEWSKDESPRYFRYAIRPLFPIWNPENKAWADIPFVKRPMVQVERAPFRRDRWTHVVFTVDGINNKATPPSGRLYIDGRHQGTIEKWDLRFGWDPKQVQLVLGAAYVGYQDDLAVFDRALTEREIQQLHGLKTGVAGLYHR